MYSLSYPSRIDHLLTDNRILVTSIIIINNMSQTISQAIHIYRAASIGLYVVLLFQHIIDV